MYCTWTTFYRQRFTTLFNKTLLTCRTVVRPRRRVTICARARGPFSHTVYKCTYILYSVLRRFLNFSCRRPMYSILSPLQRVSPPMRIITAYVVSINSRSRAQTVFIVLSRGRYRHIARLNKTKKLISCLRVRVSKRPRKINVRSTNCTFAYPVIITSMNFFLENKNRFTHSNQIIY